jgi:hypothetical protein
METTVIETTASPDNQYDNRGSHESEGPEDNSNNNRGDMGTTGRCIPTAARSWDGGLGLEALSSRLGGGGHDVRLRRWGWNEAIDRCKGWWGWCVG